MFKVKNRLKSILWERNNRVARELYSRNQTPTSLGETLKATGIAFSTLEEITGGNTEELIEFDSIASAIAAYDSPAYQAARKLLGDTVVRDIRIVEGTE